MRKLILDAGEKGSRVARILRFFLKLSSLGRSYYFIRHVDKSKKKGFAAVVDGCKNYIEETVFEDAPVTADIHRAGESKGKREGYAQAAELFGKEIRELGEKFVRLKKKYEELSQDQKDVYEKVIKAYDDELQRMNAKCDKTESENRYLRELEKERECLHKISE